MGPAGIEPRLGGRCDPSTRLSARSSPAPRRGGLARTRQDEASELLPHPERAAVESRLRLRGTDHADADLSVRSGQPWASSQSPTNGTDAAIASALDNLSIRLSRINGIKPQPARADCQPAVGRQSGFLVVRTNAGRSSPRVTEESSRSRGPPRHHLSSAPEFRGFPRCGNMKHG